MVEQGLKEAMKWINGELQDNPTANVNMLIDKASQQFHLTPLQTEFLYREYSRKGDLPSPE
ncbi:MAG: hypothetical protein ACE5G5_07920 [Candidatus Methylomirabilales bacterium]